MTTLLNVLEVKNKSHNSLEAELILTFALVIGANKIISTSFNTLKSKLFIRTIPEFLFTKRYLDKYHNSIVSRFIINEPQCYMRNATWLHYNLPLQTKIDYLHILSQRSLCNKKQEIPEHWVDSYFWSNPLIKHSDRKIHFILEK